MSQGYKKFITLEGSPNKKRFSVNEKYFLDVEDKIVRIMELGLGLALQRMSEKVSVDTGMSKASLMGKVEKVDGSLQSASSLTGNMNIVVTPKRTLKNKSISLGKRTVIARIKRTPKTIGVTFELNVLQYFLHETYRGGNYTSQEWKTINAGKYVFRKYVMAKIKNLNRSLWWLKKI